jgi:hypothetical protein
MYLDKNFVRCPPSSAMSKFHLDTKWQVPSTKPVLVRFTYTCPPINSSKIGTATRYETPKNEDGGGNTVFLDRHNVSCSGSSVIQAFHLYRPTPNTISVEYWCAPLTGNFSCSAWTATPLNDEGGGMPAYLDRHTPQCSSGQYLRSWKLQRVAQATTTLYQIRYQCCGVA